MCVVYSLAPAWRAPVYRPEGVACGPSTVTQAAVASPASRRASFSAWKTSLLAVRIVTIWPFEAQAFQLGEQTLHRHLPLDVLHQHEAHNPGAKVAGHLWRQWCYDFLAVRCHPALAAEENGVRIRSCTVNGSKPRRREPAGAS